MEIISLIVNIGRYFVEPIKKHCGYLIHYNSNKKNLEDRTQNLHDKRDGVLLQIQAAKRNGQVIAPAVETWVESVHNILAEDVEVNRKCLDGWCPRYSLSRKNKKKTLEIDGLLNRGQFAEVSYPPPPLGIESSPIEGIMDFQSRTKIMNEVLEALRVDMVNIIAICGMGGIGKTTMAKEVAKRAKEENLFDEVVMVVVSQNQDLIKIQGQLADMLDLQLKKDSLERRATQLFSRLMDSKSVLLIVDDVWEALNLKDVGIPYGGQHKRCKILLTSRSEEACNQMKTQKIFPVKFLSKEEAWNLFREMAGNCTDTPDICPIAEDIAEECGGLPVAIVTVGRALENKRKDEWIAALQQLKKSISKNIPGLDSKVYSSIELSYNYLKSDEAKSCFLLCCLFPEDYDISIEYLVRYGVGQRLFANIDNVAEARYRVHAIVKNLKRSFLLLDSEVEERVKMHDVVRDVAISIVENCGFLVGCDHKMKEWPKKDSYEHYVAISLVSEQLERHPDGLECTNLELLQLLCGTRHCLPANMFKGMIGLKVLAMQNMSFPSLPDSTQVLQNLRTLFMEYCGLEDVSAIGTLGKLEMLSFRGSNIKELPREIGNLNNLKLLDLTRCSVLRRIPPGLLSSLNNLEELYMFKVYVDWEPMEGNKEGANASLAELMSLSHHLMALIIHIPNIEVLPKDFLFKNQMIKFQIFTSHCLKMYREFGTTLYLFKNSLVLDGRDISDIAKSWKHLQLLAKSEILYLTQMKNLKNILYELDKEGFPYLKVLRVFNSKDVEYVINATTDQSAGTAFPYLESLELSELCNLKEIYHSQFPEISFSDAKLTCFGNLRSIQLKSCKRLKNVVSLSIARGLVLLQELVINYCVDMEEVFPREGEDEKALDTIMFSQLKYIKLLFVSRLTGVCTGVDPVESVQPSLNQKVGTIQHIGSLPESTTISLKLFSSKTILWSPNLEKLQMEAADSLEVVFDLEGLKVNDDCQRIPVLAQLKTLQMISLSKLTCVWNNVPWEIQGFQNLTSIVVIACRCLRYLFPPSIAKLLVELQSIEIRRCEAIGNIVQRDGEEAVDITLFPKLTSLELVSLPNLVSFWNEAYSFEWSSLQIIRVVGCPSLKTIIPGISKETKLGGAYADIEFKKLWEGGPNATKTCGLKTANRQLDGNNSCSQQ